VKLSELPEFRDERFGRKIVALLVGTPSSVRSVVQASNYYRVPKYRREEI
jgi:hypothetical protein